MSVRGSSARRALAVTLLTGSAVAGPLVAAAPAYAVDRLCSAVATDTPGGETRRESAPFEALGMAQAQDVVDRFAPRKGAPVRVAVLDSGVQTAGGHLPVRARKSFVPADADLGDYQGTAVAGLVAGAQREREAPVGFAPRAELVDVRVYVTRSSNDRSEEPSAATLAQGLRWVAGEAGRQHIKVAVVPFAVPASAELRSAVRAVQSAGVVVVAATGNRPEEGSQLAAALGTGSVRSEDAGAVFFPAGYDRVVAVNATADGAGGTALDSVVKNSRTVVAAPTYNAVSYGLNGGSCVVQEVSTGLAAGEVAGVLALLWQRFPDDRPAQIVSRLVNTANGTTDDPTPLTGAGVVQPYEALTRPLEPARDGAVERTATQADAAGPVAAPQPDEDVLATTREHAVWWGLLGGGLLIIALLLRPVLASRRTRPRP